MTWGDKIRSMTDEEMAEWFFVYVDCFDCPAQRTPHCCVNVSTCKENWLDWLKEEVET